MIEQLNPTTRKGEELRVFLAGTIDNGDSEDWQSEFIKRCENSSLNTPDNKMVIYNPRREEAPTEEELYNQIEWELDHLEKSDIIIMNLLPNSKSPISLLELGLYARSGKLTVVCSPKFYRYANVLTVCNWYNVELYDNMDALWQQIESK